ncbi:hypothetical protein IID24_03750 [Patescibacteria group bacterium]|nr:hypothetical protein [Patescibacteria group bacterium]
MRLLIETIHFSGRHIVFWLGVFVFLTLIFLWPNGVAAQSEVTLTDPVATSCTLSNPQASLTWATTLGGNPDYFVLRKLQGDAVYPPPIAGPITDTFYDDNTIVSDQSYEYQIRAEKGADTFFSNEVLVSALYCKPELTLVAASCLADGPHIDLEWSAVSGDLLRYEVHRDGGKIAETTDTNFDDGSSIEAGVSYSYFVKAVWEDLTPADSDLASKEALACPVILSSDAQCTLTSDPGGPRVDLSWNSLLGITSYQIYRQAQSEGMFSLLSATTTTSYVDDFVDSLATYAQGGQASYYIKAVWPTDDENSTPVTEDILRCEPFLTVADNCELIGFQLSWTATQGATKYNIWKDEVFLDQVDASFLFYPTDGGVDGTDPVATHKYKAVANTSPELPSNEVEASIDCTVTEPPSPVPVLEEPQPFCDTGDSQIQLDWSASDNVNYYKVYRTSAATTTVTNVGGISHIDKGLESGTEYIYYVLATGPGGETDPAAANTETVTAVSCTLPSIPDVTLSTQCTVGSPSVTVEWASDDGNTLRYVIHRREDSEASFSVKATFDKSASEFDTKIWIDTGGDVLTSTIYHYKVVAEGPIGVTPSESTVKIISTLSCLPTTPSLSLVKSCLLGNAIVDLSWSTDEANTDSYEIFRLDFMGGATPIHTIFDTSIKDWSDTSVAQATLYDYKVEAVGPVGRSTQGYESIETDICAPPDSFTLTLDTPPFCQGPYLSSQLSWTSAVNASSYNIIENRIDIPQSVTYSDVATPFTDLGLGRALDFDGNDDYVRVPDSESISIEGDQFTLAAWVFPEDIFGDGDAGIISKTDSSNRERYHLGIDRLGGVNVRRYSGGSGARLDTNDDDVVNGKWQHLVGRYDGSTLKAYVNGVEVDSLLASGNIDPSTKDLFIGRRDGSRRFTGKIDDVRIYNRALSNTEIQDLAKGLPVSASGLVGMWYFDEDSGSIASDSSNNGNDGILTGMNPATDWVSHGPQNLGDYNWQAEAFGSGGSTLSVPDPDPAKDPSLLRTAPMCEPTKPGLVLTPLCELGVGPTVVLQWSYSMNTLAYKAYREEGAIDILIDTVSQTVDPSLRIATDDNGGFPGLLPLTSYSYYVAATSVGAFSDVLSDTITVATLDCALPTIPLNVVATFSCDAGSNAEAVIGWDDSDHAISYTVWRDDDGDLVPDTAFTSVQQDTDSTFPNSTTYSWTDNSIAVNTAYTYWVIAVGPGEESALSDPVNSSISAGNYCPPSIPSVILTTECQSLSPRTTIFWEDATTFNTTSYDVYRNTSGTDPPLSGDFLTNVPVGTLSLLDSTGLSPLTTYYYWVRTLGPAGTSTFSSPRSIATYSCGIIPSAPSNLSVDALSCVNNTSTASLSWTDGSPAYSHKVFRDNPDLSTSVYSTRISSFTDSGSFALDFDGGDDYVSISDSPELSGGLPLFKTAEAWFKLRETSGNVDIVGKQRNIFQKDWALLVNDGKLRFWSESSNEDYTCTQSSGSISTGIWYHGAFVVNEPNVTLYLNGAPVGSCSDMNGNSLDTSTPVQIGAATYDSRYTDGIIDDVRIYNRALSGSEIADHAAGNYNNEAGLVGVWHFDDASGTTASDSSGFGNSGVFVNDPEWDALSSLDPTYVVPLEGGDAYTYYVKAFGPDTESASSTPVFITALECLPAKPDLMVIPQCSAGDPQLVLEWGPDSNTENWSVFKRRVADQPVGLFLVNTTATSITDTNVTDSIIYEYYVNAIGQGGQSTLSDAISQEALACASPPATPVIDSVLPVCFGSSSRIQIDWGAYVIVDTLSFEVLRKNLTGGEVSFSARATGLSPSTTLYPDFVDAGNEYVYKVRAVGAGASNFADSTESATTTGLDCSFTSPNPSDLFLDSVPISTGDVIAVSLRWTDAGNEQAIGGYRLFRRTSPFVDISADLGFPVGFPGNIIPSDVFQVDNTVVDDQVYTYRVYAYNAFDPYDSLNPLDGGTASNDLEVPVPTAKPGNFTLSGTQIGGDINLNWTVAATTAAASSVEYTVYRSATSTFNTQTKVTNAGIPCENITSPDPRECIDDIPDPAKPFYRVTATNLGGSTNSNVRELFAFLAPIWREITPF